MNFVRQGFRKLSSDRQTESTEIIQNATLRVVKNLYALHVTASVKQMCTIRRHQL